MALATARARLEEPAATLEDLVRAEPLTVAEAVQLAEALLSAPRGGAQLSAASVAVTESGSIKLLDPVPDLPSCGRVLCQALGIKAAPGRQLAAVERAAPAFVACVRALAAGGFAPGEGALEVIDEAAGRAALEPARIRARQRLRLRARQARPIARAVDVVLQPAPPAPLAGFVDKSGSPAQQKGRFVDKSVRPPPLALAGLVTFCLVAVFAVVGALLPQHPAPPRAANPTQAVWMVFDLGDRHRYAEAANLRSARLRAADPAGRSFRDRFGGAGDVELVYQRVVALDPVHGRATVEVAWTEGRGPDARRSSGVVYLVSSRSGWLWDGGTVA